MKNATLYYSVGALLYCPANNESIAHSLIHEKFGNKFSLALCLEDTIRDDGVADAESKLVRSLTDVYKERQNHDFFLPKIFIRVRASEQIARLQDSLGDVFELVTGFIVPKFSLDNADEYIDAIVKANEHVNRPVYMMPVYESASMIDLRNRYHILYSLKEKLDAIEELVLNIRVGGNDLCHMFGYRRHVTETIHQITPIANIFSDIITVYGMDYICSGPVWEYYNGAQWKNGLIHELTLDKLAGFTGKTVIHPNQIEIVNEAYKVSRYDYEDAKLILNWTEDNNSMVCGSSSKERMNEYKTHWRWAMQIMHLAEHYGIREQSISELKHVI